MQPWIKALRNLAWLTQLGLSVAAPPVLCIAGAGTGFRWAAGLWRQACCWESAAPCPAFGRH